MDVFGSLDKRIEEKIKEILRIDTIDDAFGLDDPKIIRRNETRAQLLCDLKLKNSLLKQKARAKWIREGDAKNELFP